MVLPPAVMRKMDHNGTNVQVEMSADGRQHAEPKLCTHDSSQRHAPASGIPDGGMRDPGGWHGQDRKLSRPVGRDQSAQLYHRTMVRLRTDRNQWRVTEFVR
jgi:hypothetical protein